MAGDMTADRLTVSQAAGLLGVTRQAVLRAIRLGALEAEAVPTLGQDRPMWLIKADDLELYKRTYHRPHRPKDD
jgi:excisionase family DNA binding protein